GTVISFEDLKSIQTEFHKAHKAAYGHSTPGETIKVVYLRLQAVKTLEKPRMQPIDNHTHQEIKVNSIGSRPVWFPQGQMLCQVFQRADLKVGNTLDGPAIIQEKEATTLVEPQWTLRVDKFGNMVVDKV
ncbi:MAG: hypothetical protein PVF74_15365, partial [Anaerolineales bacterium]